MPENQNQTSFKAADEMDVIQALQSSKKFIGRPMPWPLEERKALLNRLAEVIRTKVDQWSQQEAHFQNLPVDFVKENSFDHALYLIEQNLKDISSARNHVVPTGVIAVITSWSLSFRLVMESMIPALAAGNAVIVKVSSRSPVTANILLELARLAEIPEGALNVLVGEGAKVGAFLAAHPGIRGVSFVGKSKTAESIIKATAPQFKKLHLRGSVKNSAVVLSGLDDALLPELIKSFAVAGTGWSMSRLLTTEAEAPALVEKIKAVLGEQAVQKHGKPLIETDGPVFLLDLPNCSDQQQEESSEMIFPIVTVKYQHEIAKWLNNTPYGNLATIWGDEEKALKISEKLEVGVVWLNHWMRAQDESPWGLKQSAFGIPDRTATGAFFSDRKLTL